MNPSRGLFVNCLSANCSIYESGVMFNRALQGSVRYRLDSVEVGRVEDIPRDYDFYVFNYHHITMSWLDPQEVHELPGQKIAFVLEMEQDDPFVLCPDVFDAYCVPDPTLACADPRVHAFGRPLEVVTNPAPYVDQGVPIIGSFGFATPGKGFEIVVHAANKEFDRAVVRLNIPPATYADSTGVGAQQMGEFCRAIAKEGIEVQVEHRYMEKHELIEWCGENTLNVFFYDRRQPGLSATTDQAISSGRPLLVSPCDTFRHIHEYITPYPRTSLRQAIESTGPAVQAMQHDWSPERFRERFEEVLGTRSFAIPRPQSVPTAAPKINLAILTFNALEHTRSCLEHLRNNTSEPYRIFVFDNASTDGTQEYLSSLRDPRIEVRFNDVNLGVAGGRNALIRWLEPEVPEDGFLVFLDNDIDVGPGWAAPFLRLFEDQPSAGIASRNGGLMLVHEDRRQLLKNPERTAPVDVASGGFACWMRKQVCVDVGQFDEALGMFWQEDDDYAVRAVQHGWQVFCVPESPMVHHEHASGVADEKLAQGGCEDNARYLADKWRNLGLVDEDGWLIHRNSSIYLPVSLRRDLQRRLGQQAPFERRQFAGALCEVHEAIVDPEALLCRPRHVVSRLHYLLLDLFEEQSRRDGDPQLAKSVVRAREALKQRDFRSDLGPRLRASAPPVTGPRCVRRLNKLCSVEEWDDPVWRREAEGLYWDPSGPGYHHRSKEIWMQVQVQRGLRDLGCLHGGARGLAYRAGLYPLLFSLSQYVGKLTSVDDYTGRGEAQAIADPAALAPVAYPEDRLEFLDAPELANVAGSFDFAWCPVTYAVGEPVERVAATVQALARAVRPGGVLALGGSVHVGRNPAGLSPEQLVEVFTLASGCDLIEEPDLRVSADTLDGVGEGRWDCTRSPYMLHCEGEFIVTSGVLFLQKPIRIPENAASRRSERTAASGSV